MALRASSEPDFRTQIRRVSRPLQRRFLEIYRGALSRGTRLFPGMEQVLETLAAWRIKAGIVTNKAAWLTEPSARGAGTARALRLRGQRRYARGTQAPSPALAARGYARRRGSRRLHLCGRCRARRAGRARGRHARLGRKLWLLAAPARTRAAWGGDAYLNTPLDLLDWLTTMRSAAARLHD